MPKVFLIIVTYKADKFLPGLFASLAEVTTDNFELQTIVVENNSKDGTLAWLKNKPGLHLLPQTTNTGFAEGNNIGMRYALERGADYIFLLNQDTEADPLFLSTIVKVMEVDKTIGAAQSLLLLHENGTRTNKINSWGNELQFLGFGYSGGLNKSSNNISEKIKTITYASGAAVMYRATALKQVGLFDSSYFLYHEDTELSLKLRFANWKIVMIPLSKIWHKYHFGNSKTTYQYLERNRLRILLEFYKLPTLILILPMFILLEMGVSIFSMISGFFGEKIKAYGWIIKNWSTVMSKRQTIQKTRLLNEKDLAKSIVGSIDFAGINNPILHYLANPLLSIYWFLVKLIIFW